MTRRLLLALALTTAACGSAGVRVSSEASSVAVLPPPIPGTVTVPAPPPGTVILWRQDPRCPVTSGCVTLPSPVTVECLMREGRLAVMRAALSTGAYVGGKSPCWSVYGPTAYQRCLTDAALRLPAIEYGVSARFIRGLVNGQPVDTCAAGISGDPIFVMLSDPARALRLVAWESANEWLSKTFDRVDLTDGSLVATATNAAMAACGEN